MKLEPYEKRLVKEYRELTDRIHSLDNMLEHWNELDFDPECTRDQLEDQLTAMKIYLTTLQSRNDVKRLIKKGKMKYVDHNFSCLIFTNNAFDDVISILKKEGYYHG